MEEKLTRDFLIRNMPIEVYTLLEKMAKEHHRSKTQEALVALTNGLTLYQKHELKKPKTFKWKSKITDKFIEDTINEGRE